MPAAVETASYRIACEAPTNTVRHAQATWCRVSLHARGEQLVLRVEDNGSGLTTHVEPGIGLRSMRERATELGGRRTIGPADSGGTLVEVSLPFGAEPS